MINENLEEILKKCLKNPIRKKQNISIKIKNEYEHKDDGNIRFYSKAINVKGNTINTVIEVGNSINFFEDLSKLGNDKKTTSKLKKQSSFKLELKDTSKEKKSITTPSRFNEFELKRRHIEKLKNNEIFN